ncbi:MAG TPA: cytochrome P450 [Chloroflexota bacterium]|nr:cytochrome P450 [Chloroflexota bacterium]
MATTAVRQPRWMQALGMAAPPPPPAVWERLPPRPPGRPIAGNTLDYVRDPIGFVTRCYQTYGHAFSLAWFGYPLVWLIGPEGNRLILSEQPQKLLWRPALASLIPLLGEGLLVTDGALHDRLRRLVLPVFQRQRMEGYLPIMWDHAQRYAARWRPGQLIDADLAMRRLTLQIAGRTLFGVELGAEHAQLIRAFRDALVYSDVQWPFSMLRINLPFTAWGRFVRARARLDRFVYDLIRQRQADPAAGAHDDALSALLAARDTDGSGLSPVQVRDQVVQLLAAGHETTAHGLAWTLYLLAQHPAVLERVLAEQDAVLGGRPPTFDTLPRLTYLEMVTKEALRLYPPAWAGGRLTATEIEWQGYRFPPGTFVMYSQWLSHRLPEVFHDPEAFRPERFDPEHGESHPPFAYVPFGGGARLCLGMTFALQEMKVVLSALLGRWRFALEPGQRIVPRPLVTLSPRHGVRMRVRAA